MKLGALSVGFFVVGIALAGCGGGSKPTTPQCALNSDCTKLSTPGLVCAIGYCVKPCAVSSDCPNNERCVVVSALAPDGGSTSGAADAGVAQGTACQAPELATCNYTSMCTAPLHCSDDHQCRDQCETNVDCPTGQLCTSMTHLCADPAIDKDYNATINDFVVNDAGMGIPQGGNNGTGGNGTGTGGSGTGGSGTGGRGGAGGRGGSGGGTTCTAMTRFGHVATSDSNPGYTSGIGVRTATEFLIFSGYAGPPTVDGGTNADAGIASYIERIDVQHFDLTTGVKKGPSAPLFDSASAGTGAAANIQVSGVAVSPGGQIAVVYDAASSVAGNNWAVYLTFLDTKLAAMQTTQLVSVGYDTHHHQSHVQWLNGAFVASWVTNYGPIKIAPFGTDGSPAGNSIVVPTSDPSGFVYNASDPDGDLAFSGGVFAVTYIATSPYPLMTVLDPSGTEVGSPLLLPYGVQFSNVSVAATTQGFVAVYEGADSGDGGTNVASVLATLVSTSGAPGSTFSFPGGYSYSGGNGGNVYSIRGASDGTGAGFAVFYPDGSESFLYASGDGSKPTNQPILQQQNPAGLADEAHITNLAGSFAMSLYSGAEHLTRVAATGCP